MTNVLSLRDIKTLTMQRGRNAFMLGVLLILAFGQGVAGKWNGIFIVSLFCIEYVICFGASLVLCCKRY
jgi:hypothetical protein